MFSVELPLPPSSNNAYLNVAGRGRIPSKAHKAWKLEAGWALQLAKLKSILGRYALRIIVPAGMRGDVSNRIKLAEDLLVEMGLTPDDRHAASVSIERGAVPKNRCRVEAWEA